jgi:hypothetical protein
MSTTRRQILYVNSSLRNQGEPNDYRIQLGNDVLRARKGFRTRLAIAEATLNRSWYNVKEGANSIQLNSSTITLPVGSYNALDLRVALAQSLPTGWTVVYNRLTSKYSITRPVDATEVYLLSLNSIGPLLGFADSSTVIFSTLLPTITSPQPARVNSENSIYIHTDITKSGGSVLDNMINANTFNDSTVIAKIPIDAPPNDNIIFRMQNDLEFIELPHGHTDSLRLWVTDENNAPLQLSFDWTCTLVVIHEPDDSQDVLNTLQESRDLLKLMALEGTLSSKSVLRLKTN